MKLKYVNGKLVQEGFNGSMGAHEDSVMDVRLDALKLPDYKHNEKLEKERQLKNIVLKKQNEIKKNIKLLEQKKEWELQKKYKDISDRLAAAAVKEKNEQYKEAVKNFSNRFMEANMKSRTTMTKNPFLGFGSGEGEVYHTGSVHNLKADFDTHKMIQATESSNTNIDSFKRVEQNTLNNYKVDKAVSSASAAPKVPVIALSNSHPMVQFTRHAYIAGPMGGWCCGIDLPRISTPKISLPNISLPSLPSLKLPEIKLPNLSLPSMAMPSLSLPNIKLGGPLKVDLSLPTIGEVGKAVGGIMTSDLNPILAADRALKSIPGVRDVYRDLDKFSGGTFTSLTNLTKMPGRALKGEAISQAEFADAASFALKAGLLVASGGSAAAIIGTMAGQLKKGPLGESELGKNLLSIGEVAGIAYATGEIVSDVVASKAKDEAIAKMSGEAAKKAGAAGSILVVAAAGKYSNPDSSFVGNTMVAAQGEAKKAAVVEMQKKTGVPVGLATQMVDGSVPTQNDVQAAIVQESKAKAATEFEKKTGIPVTLAAQVAQGKMPSMSEIKEKVYTGLAKAPEELQAQVDNIDEQMKTAPKNVQVILIEKKKALQETIANREKIKAEASKQAEAKFDEARAKVQKAGEDADKLRLTQKELSDKALALRHKALQQTDEKLKDQLIAQAELIEKQMLSLDPKRKASEDQAKKEIRAAEELKQRLAYEQLTVEYGAKDPKRTTGMSTGAKVAIAAGVVGVGAMLLANGAEA